MDDKREMLEPFAVPDTFVSGLGSVEDMGGGNFRFTFYTAQDHDFVVAAKLIMSIVAVPEAMHMTAVETRACACEGVRKLTRN